MQVILHCGAHQTDENRLIKCLLRNAGDFARTGIAVPNPGRYRRLLTQTLTALASRPPSDDAREILLDAILDDEETDVQRLLLSHEHLFCVTRRALHGGMLYEGAEMRLHHMAQLFAGDRIELFLAIRNPATFLPAAYASATDVPFTSFLDGADPLALRWSHLITRLRAAHPGIPVTIWCNEDSPVLWGEIVRGMAGLPPDQKITGAFDLLSEIMTAEGMKRFRAYLKDHPVMSEPQKRRVMIAFLDKFAIEGMIEEELDLPGWNAAMIDEMSARYDEDVDLIAAMPGVTLLTP